MGCHQSYLGPSLHLRTYVQPHSQSALRFRRWKGWHTILRRRLPEPVWNGDADCGGHVYVKLALLLVILLTLTRRHSLLWNDHLGFESASHKRRSNAADRRHHLGFCRLRSVQLSDECLPSEEWRIPLLAASLLDIKSASHMCNIANQIQGSVHEGYFMNICYCVNWDPSSH
jgi:hypothetical protein